MRVVCHKRSLGISIFPGPTFFRSLSSLPPSIKYEFESSVAIQVDGSKFQSRVRLASGVTSTLCLGSRVSGSLKIRYVPSVTSSIVTRFPRCQGLPNNKSNESPSPTYKLARVLTPPKSKAHPLKAPIISSFLHSRRS